MKEVVLIFFVYCSPTTNQFLLSKEKSRELTSPSWFKSVALSEVNHFELRLEKSMELTIPSWLRSPVNNIGKVYVVLLFKSTLLSNLVKKGAALTFRYTV